MAKKECFDPEKILNAKKVFDFLEIDGKYYRFIMKDGKTLLQLEPNKEIKNNLKLAKKLANELKDSVDTEKILMEIFMTRYDLKSLQKLEKTVFGKRKYKARTRADHCVDMKIGNHIIPLVD